MAYTGYAYTFNRPIMMTDPTGHWPGFVDNAVKKVKNVASAGYSAAKDGVSKGVNVAASAAKSTASKVARSTKSAINSTVNFAKDVGSATWSGIKSGASTIWEHKGWVAAGLAVAALTVAAFVTLPVTGPVTLAALAGVGFASTAGVGATLASALAIGSIALTMGGILESGATMITGILVGDQDMVFEGGIGAILGGLGFIRAELLGEITSRVPSLGKVLIENHLVDQIVESVTDIALESILGRLFGAHTSPK